MSPFCITSGCINLANNLLLAADWNAGLVPEKFQKYLFKNYRDYFDNQGNMKERREKSYEAFLYFVDRILPSVNADVTKYHGDTRCIIQLSSVFRVSDEAFALLMVDNYIERWVEIAQDEKENPHRDKDEAQAKRKRQRAIRGKYTCSSNGNVHGGWEEEGIARYNEYFAMVKEMRKEKGAKQVLDNKLMNHWKGMQEDTTTVVSRNSEKKMPIRALVDDEDD